ncbi:hypothetical protein [Rubripirellula amarantea]|nr:hypothetical protein [Rubripirellula amarantea]
MDENTYETVAAILARAIRRDREKDLAVDLPASTGETAQKGSSNES